MTADNRRPLVAAALLLGVGLGGFIDGITFHQLLQWHSMLSAQYPPTSVTNMEITMFWDGLFHAFTWLMTAAGLATLWWAMGRADVPHCGRTLLGGLALGWGLFNLIEGLIDHHLLHVHHVTETANHLYWDLGFLASGAALILLGAGLIRAGGTPSQGRPAGEPAAEPMVAVGGR